MHYKSFSFFQVYYCVKPFFQTEMQAFNFNDMAMAGMFFKKPFYNRNKY